MIKSISKNIPNKKFKIYTLQDLLKLKKHTGITETKKVQTTMKKM